MSFGSFRFFLLRIQLTGYDIPEIVELTTPMLSQSHEARPTSMAVLQAFNRMEARIENRLRMSPAWLGHDGVSVGL